MATSILKNAIHSSLAKTLLDEILSKKNKYYYTFGKTDPWDLAETPQSAIETLEYEYTARSNIVTCQEILSNDVCLVIDRINWVLGAVYDQYDNYSETNVAFSGATSLDTANFYILTDEFNVYKCISNNRNSASAVRPTGQSTGFINIPEDGYVWKFMYNIPLYLRNKFLNSSQMPVVNALQTGYYSDGRLSQVIFNLKGTKYHENTSLGSVATKTVSGVTNLRKFYGTNSAILSLVATDRIEVNGEVRSVASVATEVVESVTYYVITTASNEPLLRVTSLSPAKKLNTELEIIGDGYKQANPYLITAANVIDGGSGFVTNNGLALSFPAPYQTGSVAAGTVTVNVNVLDLTVSSAGSGYTQVPTVEITSGGGTGATATAILGFPLSSTISISASGSGYTTPPTITFNGGDGTGAAATAIISGTIEAIEFTPGNGYATAPTITIGAQWAQTTALVVDQQIAYGGGLYTAVGAGTTGTVAPTHTTTTVTAGSFVVGYKYTIATLGTTTNWQSIGAPLGAVVGTSFVATGVGSGNGTATTTYASNGTAILSYAGVAASGIVTISAGLVQSIALIGGSGYTSTPSVTFSGGSPATEATGTAKLNAYVASIVVTNAGSGYTSTPLVVITPYGVDIGATIIPAEALATLSPINGSVKDITLTNAGVNYTSAPTVTVQAPTITFNGSTAVSVANDTITYINHGLQNGAAVVYSNGGGTSITGLTSGTTYYANVTSTSVIKLYDTQGNAVTGGATGLINITATGVGSNHTLTNMTAGFQATSTSVVSSGFIKSAILTDPGYGYTVVPTPFLTFTNGWVAGGIVALNQEVTYQNRIYKVTAVTNPYNLGSSPPSHTTGAVANGDATLTYLSTVSLPSFQTTAEKTKAYIDPIVDVTNGEIRGAIIIDGGTGYTYATCEVKRNKPPTSGTGLDAQLTIDTSIGTVNSVQAQVELSAINGSLDNYQVIAGGVGYVQASTTVSIVGDGTGATATATVESGAITKINIITRGKDYTNATVTIVGVGSGAQVRAIIGPIGGHGRSCIDELNGRTVIMYNRLSQIQVKGIALDALTNIRQVCVLKSPNLFNSVFNYNNFAGSTCYKITLASTPTTAALNSTVTVYISSSPSPSSVAVKFRVIAKSGNSLILQAIDNNDELIKSGYFMRTSAGVFHPLTYVEKPDVDRFSGDLIFIDNKSPFAPTVDQPLVITTRFKL